MTPISMAIGAMFLAGIAAVQSQTWRDETGGRSLPLTPIGAAKEGFTELARDSGILFTNTLAATRSLTNQIYLNGSGVAAGDIDGDGWCDLYFAALDRPGALFRNLGNWKFADITAASGLPTAPLDSTGAALADLDGDGDLDLIFNTVGRGTRLYANDGSGKFTAQSQFNAKLGGMSLALADIDGDGDLDIYIANYRTVTIRDEPNTRFNIRMIDGQPTVATINGRPATDPDLKHRFTYKFSASAGRGTFGHEENGEPDLLLRNDGAFKFTEVKLSGANFSDSDGKPFPADWLELDWGLAAMFRDINQDGAPDLYVCNDFKSEDRLWLGDGRGNFRAAPKLALRKQSLSAMAVDFADLNRDGFDDFLVADMLSRDHKRRMTQMAEARPEAAQVGESDNRPASPQNTLFLNGGDNTYREIANYAGLEATEWTWAIAFIDVDLDGFEDLLVCNGFERDNMNMDVLREMDRQKAQKKMSAAEQLEMRKMFARLATPNLAFRNLGNLRFEDASQRWGFHAPAVSIGMALADLDNDGDQDLIVNNLNDPALLYRNDSPAPRLAVRLKGATPNTRGIGARVELAGAKLTQAQEIVSGGRYLSSDQPLRAFAALDSEATLKIRWRSGKESIVKSVTPNRLYEIDETAAQSPAPKTRDEIPSPIRFEDVSARLNHIHRDEPFDDFARQPLLPKKYSQFGPELAWYDIDGDRIVDLLIGAAKGGRMGIFRSDGKGGFSPLTNAPFDAQITRDQTTLLGLQRSILAGSSNYEDGLPIMSGLRHFVVGADKPDDSLLTLDASTGPLALLDIDGDGDPDLFRAARCLPGKIPAPASSWIYKNNTGKFELDPAASAPFAKIGLVTAALAADFNSDTRADLAIACEWGPIRIFLSENGKLVERTKQFGLENYLGWWTSLAAADLNKDGALDLVAGNFGSNTKYQSFRPAPLKVAHGDFDGDGSYDLVEARFDPITQRDLPLRNLEALAKAMPLLREKFPTHAAFAQATLQDIVGATTNILTANWLETTLFLNRGATFEAKTLPLEAQLSPAMAIAIADFDSDRNPDLFLSQNFFARDPESPRCDAGWGLVLRGDGAGNFTPLTPTQSGIRIPGEQRGAAIADFDHDGRPDLAIGQNAGPTKLYRNISPK